MEGMGAGRSIGLVCRMKRLFALKKIGVKGPDHPWMGMLDYRKGVACIHPPLFSDYGCDVASGFGHLLP